MGIAIDIVVFRGEVLASYLIEVKEERIATLRLHVQASAIPNR